MLAGERPIQSQKTPMIDVRSSPVAVLISGGLDSCILLSHLLSQQRRVQPLYVRGGLVWEEAEFAAVRRFLDAVRTPALGELVALQLPLGDLYENHWSTTGQDVPPSDSPDEAVFLPGRNLLLIVKAAVWCQLNQVPQLALAPLGTSPFADATPAFFASFQSVLNLTGQHPIEILAPFAQRTKLDVIQLGTRLPLHLTFSCIAPSNGRHCGRCNKCAERHAAFASAGWPDPTDYAEK